MDNSIFTLFVPYRGTYSYKAQAHTGLLILGLGNTPVLFSSCHCPGTLTVSANSTDKYRLPFFRGLYPLFAAHIHIAAWVLSGVSSSLVGWE